MNYAEMTVGVLSGTHGNGTEPAIRRAVEHPEEAGFYIFTTVWCSQFRDFAGKD